MHCRGTEKDWIPRESSRGGILTPHTIAHRDKGEPGELLEYRRHRALNASITIIIEMRQNYARPCNATILENRAGINLWVFDAPDPEVVFVSLLSSFFLFYSFSFFFFFFSGVIDSETSGYRKSERFATSIGRVIDF